MTGPDDGFIGRWSRRKRAAEQNEAAPPPAEPIAAPDPVPEPGPVPLTDEELAALPRVEDLAEGSDIRMFLRVGVPRALRSAALRKVWMLTPAIRDYKNPAVDYAWDYNTPGGVPGDGCAPSPERAAQMLRDLFAPRTPAEPEGTALAEADGAEIPPAEGVTPEGDDPDPATDPDTQMSDARSESPRQAVLSVPRHRHGGALPS